LRLKNPFKTKNSRRYPVRYDDRGRSLRARCFELFDDGERPIDAAKQLKGGLCIGIKMTLSVYFLTNRA